MITGTGGGTAYTAGMSDVGIVVTGATQLHGSTVTLTGTGGSSNALGKYNIGVWIANPGTAIYAGQVSITGTGKGAALSDDGIDILSGAVVGNRPYDTVQLNGTAGDGSSTGVLISGVGSQVGGPLAQEVKITGSATGSANHPIEIINGAVAQSLHKKLSNYETTAGTSPDTQTL